MQGAQDQLDRAVPSEVALVRHLECRAIPTGTLPGAAGCALADPQIYQDRLVGFVVPNLAGDRLLLLDSRRRVLFDSAGRATGQVVVVQASQRFAGVADAQPEFEGQPYLAAAAAINAARDPLGAAFVLVATRLSAIAAAAATDLVPRLLIAAAAALVLALILVLFVSRSVTGPLTQLARAAEDIAAGNYSRRVGIRGVDEVGQLGTAFDRMAEAVERSRRAQREFLANVSHELKTPLTSLIGFSQALTDGSLKTDVERTRAAQIVHEESERVLRMAQELLDLARVEAGTISIHATAVDIAGHIDEEVEFVRPRAAARDLSLVRDMPPDLPPVSADPERLHQVLGNLFDNAVKYAPSLSEVRIAAARSGGMVEIVVSNAIGDHRPDPQRMFERFYRADASRSAAAGGVGLGLAISRELTAAMRGRLWAEIDGGLLRMHLVLPAVPDAASRPAPPLAATA